MQKRRVVVTGMGCLTPVGNTINQFWESILAGKSGVSKITSVQEAVDYVNNNLK